MLAVVCLAQLMIVLDATIVNVGLPTIQDDLGPIAALGAVLAALTLRPGPRVRPEPELDVEREYARTLEAA